MKRLVVLISIIGIFIAGVYVGSLDLSFASTSSKLTELQPSSTEPPPELTEQQVIDIFLIDLNPSSYFEHYGCLEGCANHNNRLEEMFPEGNWDELVLDLLKEHQKALFKTKSTAVKYSVAWTAEYVKDGWWLISAKKLGYWLLNEDKEWLMTCGTFSIPDLMNIIGKYIATTAPAAEGICSAAVES